jgi:hypothetical protein
VRASFCEVQLLCLGIMLHLNSDDVRAVEHVYSFFGLQDMKLYRAKVSNNN